MKVGCDSMNPVISIMVYRPRFYLAPDHSYSAPPPALNFFPTTSLDSSPGLTCPLSRSAMPLPAAAHLPCLAETCLPPHPWITALEYLSVLALHVALACSHATPLPPPPCPRLICALLLTAATLTCLISPNHLSGSNLRSTRLSCLANSRGLQPLTSLPCPALLAT